uniref:Copine domain-containing protein n=1 Tax=Macrostomum lignano TaxID=282301 RepID=A0A1I8JQU3_9PLAT
ILSSSAQLEDEAAVQAALVAANRRLLSECPAGRLAAPDEAAPDAGIRQIPGKVWLVKEPPRDAEAAADSANSPRQLRKFSSLTSSSSAASAKPLPPTGAAPGGSATPAARTLVSWKSQPSRTSVTEGPPDSKFAAGKSFSSVLYVLFTTHRLRGRDMDSEASRQGHGPEAPTGTWTQRQDMDSEASEAGIMDSEAPRQGHGLRDSRDMARYREHCSSVAWSRATLPTNSCTTGGTTATWQAQFITLLVVAAAVPAAGTSSGCLFGRQEVYIHCGGVTEAECCHSANPDRPLPAVWPNSPPNPDRFRTLNEVKDALRKAGLESANLIFGIDFTASNNFQVGPSESSFGRAMALRASAGRSLHDLHSGGLNPYQSVIITLGETMETFQTDCDGHIPAFGFGDFRYKNGAVFPLGTEDTCCGFQAVQICRATGSYHILVIVADGQVRVRARDARQFDNFRFVNYHATVSENRHNPEIAFAVAALMEIPDQYNTPSSGGWGCWTRETETRPRCLLLFYPPACCRCWLQLLLAAQILLRCAAAGEEHNGRVQEDRPGCEGSEGRGDAEGGVCAMQDTEPYTGVCPVVTSRVTSSTDDAGEHQARWPGRVHQALPGMKGSSAHRQAAQRQAAGRYPSPRQAGAPGCTATRWPRWPRSGTASRGNQTKALLRVRGLVAVVHPDAQRGGQAVVGQVGPADQGRPARHAARCVGPSAAPPQRRRPSARFAATSSSLPTVWHYEMNRRRWQRATRRRGGNRKPRRQRLLLRLLLLRWCRCW